MQRANMTVTASNDRPLYLPPAEYFTRVGDAQLVCRAASGELVSLRDDRCPADVRKALQVQGPTSSILGTQDAKLSTTETGL
jgi:hypothetical protein